MYNIIYIYIYIYIYMQGLYVQLWYRIPLNPKL